MPITLIIADDHPLVVDGLINLFALEPEFTVLAHCATGDAALAAIKEHRPDVAVLDINMPVLSGLDIARALKDQKLSSRIVLFTAALDDDLLIEAVCLGVQGIVLKELAPHLLVQCIKKVHAGEQWLERRVATLALERMMRREAGTQAFSGLTQREIELVRLVAQGHRNREIATLLFISEGTVKAHLHNIYDKLQIDGRMALLRFAQEKGLV
jgi:DNA-binding NarL/FixJ family response regulator